MCLWSFHATSVVAILNNVSKNLNAVVCGFPIASLVYTVLGDVQPT